MLALQHHLISFKNFIWATPLLILILGSGIFLTVILKGVQFRYFGFAMKQAFGSQGGDSSQGDISNFESLMTFLAGAIGTGAITGVATGIAVGGMGTLFWMWLMGLLGMAIRYSEALLSIRYRKVDASGEMIGGPMEYIEEGLGWKWLAVLFAVLAMGAVFGMGNLVQSNAIGDAMTADFSLNPWITGAVVAFFTGIVILGGVKSVGRVTAYLVPVMAFLYVGGGLLIIILNIGALPGAIKMIFTSAFTGQAAVGGFVGSSIMTAIQMGVARGVFSSEAGLGISAIAASAAKTDYSGRQAMVAMTGVFFATVVICTLTGLVMGVMGVLGDIGPDGKMLSGTLMAMEAFKRGISGGGYIVTIGLVLFAYSTIIAWAYYGEKICLYLFGTRSVVPFRIIFTLILIPGAAIDLELVWAFADVFNGLMSIPNLIAVLALTGVILSETKIFLRVVNK